MKIPWKTWSSYIKDLRKVNDEAGRLVLDYMATHEIYTPEQVDDLIRYCYAIATRYGEAASTLAARMYDSIAEAAGVAVESALPAATATYGDVASAVLGARKQSGGDELVASAVSRQVKLAGVDTTMQNAIRDGAEWAWIPVGETCAFCITLASNGWQPASKKALKGGHAEHIHANCDCTYAIRFDSSSNVEGYDPEKYRDLYYGAEGDTSHEKINAMRRDIRESHKQEINARKRELYAEAHPSRLTPNDVTKEYFTNARPGIGVFTIEDESYRKSHPNEVRIAELIFENLGGDISVRKERPGQENADFLWGSKLWELKSPEQKKNLTKLIQKGLSQIFDNPGGLIVDRTSLDLDLESVEEIITGRMDTSMKNPTDVIIIQDQTVEKVLRYKK